MMVESKDQAIKLFGMKIPLSTGFKAAEQEEAEEISPDKNQNETLTDQSEKDDKSLKKPTKIIPCPRCNSMDTKFCYYNNYNVNQPRHFCKACQRYWTSGGTMRSVPVGAGRRKNKNYNNSSSPSSASHYRHVTIPEPNSPILRFGNPNDVDCSRNNNNEMNGVDRFRGVSWPYTWNPGFYYPYWNIPMLSSSPNHSPSTNLGKHSREEENETTMHGRKQRNGFVLVPKTLRIDDPNEAVKSSIWTTLGIKNEANIMFNGFDDSKKEVKMINKGEETETSLVLSANLAALSRSINFHERI